MTPNQFSPACAEDFVGPGRRHAAVIIAKCDRLLQSKDGNYRILFHGPQGTGKSSLARLAADRFTGGNIFAVQFSNGQVAMHWTSQLQSIAIFDSTAVVEAIHGHEGKTHIEWIDK